MNQPESSQSYRHPGQAFVESQGLLEPEQDVLRYLDFLRQSVGLSDQPPIQLSQIYQHFGMPEPLRAPLQDQQGILLDSTTGLILIKEDDPLVRQRFTEGHELMELLFDACPWSPRALPEARKERLCDRGAAMLLMPESSFLPQLNQLGVSFATGRTLATQYQTSLMATLMRMMECTTGAHALVVWHPALRRGEEATAAKKLRIWWRVGSSDWTEFIPKNKSISPESLVARAFTTGQPQQGRETVMLPGKPVLCYVEALPMQFADKACVLSLLTPIS